MKTHLVSVLSTLGTLALIASCGGGSGGTCANTPACGGNIVGTWKITSSCLSVDVGMLDVMDCPGETVKKTDFSISGTATYADDGTYQESSVINVTATYNLPSSCLASGGMTCPQLSQTVMAGAASAGFQSASCVAAASGCDCTIVFEPMNGNETGTYTTTAAGVLTETDTGSADSNLSDYCVSGSKLTESPHADSTGMMGQGSVSGTITLTKQ